jgi:hypothetical protein
MRQRGAAIPETENATRLGVAFSSPFRPRVQGSVGDYPTVKSLYLYRCQVFLSIGRPKPLDSWTLGKLIRASLKLVEANFAASNPSSQSTPNHADSLNNRKDRRQ